MSELIFVISSVKSKLSLFIIIVKLILSCGI